MTGAPSTVHRLMQVVSGARPVAALSVAH